MVEDHAPQPPRPRQSTVQAGRASLFGGGRDRRWDGQGGTVEGPRRRWFGSGGRKQEPQPKLWPQPAPTGAPSPPQASAPAVATGGASDLGHYAVPFLILAFALATTSIVLPAIALVIWLQRQRVFPNFNPPWHDPARVRAWAERYRARYGVDARPLPAFLADWLRDPPYADAAAFKAWIDRRLAQAFLALCGLIIVFRIVSALADRPAVIAPGVI